MSGNVQEWVWDYWFTYVAALENPSGTLNNPNAIPNYPNRNPYRISRGGSYSSSNTNYLRSAYRTHNTQPFSRTSNIGFRLCRTAP